MSNRPPAGSTRSPAIAAQEPTADLKRRHFLLALGVGGAGAAATAVAAVPGIAAPAIQAAAPDDGSTYRETEHVRAYYRTARN